MVPYSSLKQFLGNHQGNLLSRSAQGSGFMPLRKVIVERQQICHFVYVSLKLLGPFGASGAIFGLRELRFEIPI